MAGRIKSLTPLGIKPTTFQLVAQCLNQQRHLYPISLFSLPFSFTCSDLVLALRQYASHIYDFPNQSICENKWYLMKHLEKGFLLWKSLYCGAASVQTCLCRYIYKRLKFLGNRYISQAAALTFLAVWHGLHSGYYMCFLLEFVVMKLEKDVSIDVLYFRFYVG